VFPTLILPCNSYGLMGIIRAHVGYTGTITDCISLLLCGRSTAVKQWQLFMPAILLHVYSNCCSLTLTFCLRFTLPLAILPGHWPGMPGCSPDRCVLSELAIVKVEGHSSPVQSSPLNPLQSTGRCPIYVLTCV